MKLWFAIALIWTSILAGALVFVLFA